MSNDGTPAKVRLTAGLGPLPEDPVGVLIRGDGGAWRLSCGEFLRSLYQQPAGDHPLFTETQVRAMLAAERERCARVCDDEARIRTEAGNAHPEDSDSRGRCFAAARAAMNCATGIRGGEVV